MWIRIITDDFTSATDGIAAFAQEGWSTAVALNSSAPAIAEVMSADTDSRHAPEAVAAQRVSAWASLWSEAAILVKQFDSTLRGLVAPECIAALAASGRRKMLVAPAFPSAGRTTVNGEVRVHGVPVHRSAFGEDPLHPVRVSNVAALFARYSGLRCARNAAEAEKLLRNAPGVLVDAATEEDLDAIVRTFANQQDLLWAGSTGLVRALARTVRRAKSGIAASKPIPSAKPWVVVGSANPASHTQLEALNKLRYPYVISAPRVPGDPQAIKQHLAQTIREKIKAGECDGFVVTGGDTAKSLASALEASSLAVVSEVEPGIPLCVMATPYGALPIVTKAGGFGRDDVFVRCLQALRSPTA